MFILHENLLRLVTPTLKGANRERLELYPIYPVASRQYSHIVCSSATDRGIVTLGTLFASNSPSTARRPLGPGDESRDPAASLTLSMP